MIGAWDLDFQAVGTTNSEEVAYGRIEVGPQSQCSPYQCRLTSEDRQFLPFFWRRRQPTSDRRAASRKYRESGENCLNRRSLCSTATH